MNTRSNSASSSNLLSAGSKAWASTPCRCNAANTREPLLSETLRSADLPPRRTATFPKSFIAEVSVCPISGLYQLSRHAADRASTHGDHHIAIAGHIQNGLWHVGNILDKNRLNLARHPKRPCQRTTVGRDNRRFAGGIDF